MSQTIKFGRLRAKSDPDRDAQNHGVYYGKNWQGRTPYTPGTQYRNTNGAFVKRGQ